MFMHKRTKTSVAALLALSGLTSVAFAQSTPQTIERVEVTGSRIRSIDAETAQPVLKVSQADIQKSGLTTVGDIINALASAGTPDFSKGNVLTSNREQGGQFINLRNLGSLRLLVLVNGKRWTQTVAGYSDVSTIPSSMIDRVEILKDGASSIYGSDAIAGVVNFILKKSMTGATASVYYGQNEKGDGKTEVGSFSFGAGDEKASIMFGFNYNKQGTVWAKDREITSSTYGPELPTAGYGLGPWGRYRAIDPVTGKPTGSTYILNHTGGALGDGTGSDSRDPANYHVGAAVADNFNSTSQMMFQSPTEQKSIFTKGSVELSNTVRFSTTAMYSQRDSSRQVAGYPLQSTTQATYPVYIDKNSYYNPLGSSVTGGTGKDLFFQRRTIEVPRVTDNNNQTFHIDGGLEGELKLGEKAWNWNVGFNYNQTNGTVLSTGNINLLNLKKSLGPSFKNASGVVQCGTAASPIPLAECRPWDILGGPSASNSDVLNYVMSTGQSSYGSTVKSLTADVAGEVFTLPAGAVGLAAGLEQRNVQGYDRPGQFEQSGFSTDLAGNATTGKYTVKEAYLELNVPLLKGAPLAELLSVNLATRHSDYDNFGGTTNSKASFMWKPVKDLLTRGTWAQGFRAPTLGDTFGGGSQTYDTYLDPCDTVYGAAKSDAAVQARCAAAGTPAGFRQIQQSGAPIPSAGGAQSTSPFSASAGNLFLTPETSVTKTIGFVFSPSAIQGLTASLDWYNILIKNRITGVSANYVLNQCYSKNVTSFCSTIKRDPSTGQVTALTRGNANLGQLEVEGLDLNLAYRLPKQSFGQVGLRTDISYVDKYKVKSTDGDDSTWINYAGEFPYYRVKANFTVDWSLGDWSASLTSRYYGATKSTCLTDTIQCNTPEGTWSDGTGYNRLGALVYSDLSVGYKTPWKGQIMVGANNVFNKKARFNMDADASATKVDADLPIDRFFWVRYNQSF